MVGLPRPLSGGSNAQVQKVMEFVTTLAESSRLEVETWDERFTSRLADAHSDGTTPSDSVAACYMLQNYLDSRARERGEK